METKNILTEQSKHSISDCLKELKWSRPAEAQKFIDELIKTAERWGKNQKLIYKDIVSSISAGESSRVYMSTDTDTGKSELIIKKSITEYFPMEDYEKVMDLHDRLNCGSGRKIWTLNEIAHPFNPK